MRDSRSFVVTTPSMLMSEGLPSHRGLGAIASELKSAESPWPL